MVLRLRGEPPLISTGKNHKLMGFYMFEIMKKQKTFAIAGNTRRGKIQSEKPSNDLEKRLDTTSEPRRQVAKRGKTTPNDDVTHGPLHLTLVGEDSSPSRTQTLTWINHPTNSPVVTNRLRCLIEELYQYDPHAADQLSNARTEQDFLTLVCGLFDLSRALTFSSRSSPTRTALADAITHFMNQSLHTGPTLKTLAEFLGYSEKYCSDLFRSTMGESFSCYLKRRRTERAATLLRTTDKSVTEIASVLGFSDPFTFSHFFKRSTGQSPCAFRTTRPRRRSLQTRFQRLRGTHCSPSD